MIGELRLEGISPLSRADARVLGLSRFFTGRPCRRGHVAERFTSNFSCVECALIHAAGVIERDPDGNRRRGEAYRRRHPEAATRVKDWKAANPEKVRASRARHAQEAVDRVTRWRQENPEKFRALAAVTDQNRRARKLEASGDGWTAADIERIWQHQAGICWWCPNPLDSDFHRDHRFPLAKGGSHDPANIVLACQTCNLKKGAKMPWEFAGRLL